MQKIYGIMVHNGTIDPDYWGNVGVILFNFFQWRIHCWKRRPYYSKVFWSSWIHQKDWKRRRWFCFYKCLMFFCLFSFWSNLKFNAKSTYPNLVTFEKKLYQYNTIEELHYKLLIIMLLITHNGWFYCFGNKYQGCEFSYNRGHGLCPLCRIPAYLSGYEEELDWNPFNLFKLKQFGSKLFPLLLECYCISKRCLKAFSGDFCYSSRDHYTGQKSDTPLREEIKFRTKFKRNGEKKYFDFFY